MRLRNLLLHTLVGLAGLSSGLLHAQIDPDKRQLVQLGHNTSFAGHVPIAGYAFYYLNRPDFLRENVTLRTVVAPVYFDSEVGLSHVLGPNTDLGIGLAGGGFADSFNEVRGGKYFPKESFDGHGGGGSVSLYHRFNPRQRVPLFAIARAGVYYSTYSDAQDTAGPFRIPEDRASANFRVGLRLGGKEPVLFPNLSMELSLWMESMNRGTAGRYGYAGDRETSQSVQLFYAFAYLAYTFDRGDNLSVSMTAGDSVESDRFSAYRLGGVLPLISEFPLMIPGYFYQEISAERFLLFNGRYALALDRKKQWQLTGMAATAVVDYIDGHRQPVNWHSGLGGGITYSSPAQTWKASLNYGYGIDGVRNGERGAHLFSVLVQFDLETFLNKFRSKPFPWEL